MKYYRFLTGPDDAEFCARVTKHLNEGWELYGSPTLTFNGEKVVAGQAVIREDLEQHFKEMVLPKP